MNDDWRGPYFTQVRYLALTKGVTKEQLHALCTEQLRAGVPPLQVYEKLVPILRDWEVIDEKSQ